MRKILLFILSIALVFSLSAFLFACGDETVSEEPCEIHKDEDENGICDVCKEVILEIPKGPEEVNVSFTVKDQDGVTVPSVKIAFVEKGKTDAVAVVGTSGTDGKFTAKLFTATYTLDCNYDVDSIGYYFLDTTEIKIEEGKTELDIILINNTPNGTEDRPYPLSVGDNEITIPAGKSYHYIVYRAVNLIASIEASGIKVMYGDAQYTPDSENKINFAFNGTDTNSVENLVIENTTSEEITFNVAINSAPGTLGNPYTVEELGVEVSKDGITSKDIIYYSYTATFTGTLTLTVTSEGTNAAMASNYKQVTTISENSNVISLEVSEGDRVIIDLASAVEENAVISFILTATAVD